MPIALDPVVARRGVDRYEGRTVHFVDGRAEEFDAIIMATGFRVGFPFLPGLVSGPLDLNLMHPAVPRLYFIGLFQPVGCIWRLADNQARVAALQISGRLPCPPDLEARIRREAARRRDLAPRSGIEVDHARFERLLRRELAGVDQRRVGRPAAGHSAGPTALFSGQVQATGF